MTKDKRTKFNQYVIIGGSLGILTGFIFLAVILLTSPTDVPINAYYNPSPSGHQPWLGCSTTVDHITYSVTDSDTGITTNYTLDMNHASIDPDQAGLYDINGDRI